MTSHVGIKAMDILQGKYYMPIEKIIRTSISALYTLLLIILTNSPVWGVLLCQL